MTSDLEDGELVEEPQAASLPADRSTKRPDVPGSLRNACSHELSAKLERESKGSSAQHQADEVATQETSAASDSKTAASQTKPLTFREYFRQGTGLFQPMPGKPEAWPPQAMPILVP